MTSDIRNQNNVFHGVCVSNMCVDPEFSFHRCVRLRRHFWFTFSIVKPLFVVHQVHRSCVITCTALFYGGMNSAEFARAVWDSPYSKKCPSQAIFILLRCSTIV